MGNDRKYISPSMVEGYGVMSIYQDDEIITYDLIKLLDTYCRKTKDRKKHLTIRRKPYQDDVMKYARKRRDGWWEVPFHAAGNGTLESLFKELMYVLKYRCTHGVEGVYLNFQLNRLFRSNTHISLNYYEYNMLNKDNLKRGISEIYFAGDGEGIPTFEQTYLEELDLTPANLREYLGVDTIYTKESYSQISDEHWQVIEKHFGLDKWKGTLLPYDHLFTVHLQDFLPLIGVESIDINNLDVIDKDKFQKCVLLAYKQEKEFDEALFGDDELEDEE